MGKIKPDDILVTPLSRIDTNGGDVLHGMKSGDVGCCGFGEVYFSWVSAGAIKAWKCHTRMTMNLIVPIGKVRFVFRIEDEGCNDNFRVEEIGGDRYCRVTVPPGVWFGFQGFDSSPSLVVNIANIPHDPGEVKRLPLSDINYAWE